MDSAGRIAAHTGRECIDWCGHIPGDGFSLAGNMLAGAAVLDDTAKAYAANAALPFAQRLIAAMKAGEAAGGDKRGKQSAALVIQGEEEWSDLDLRVELLVALDRAEWRGAVNVPGDLVEHRLEHVDRHEANAPLDEPAGEQTRLAELVAAVGISESVGLLLQLECLAGLL